MSDDKKQWRRKMILEGGGALVKGCSKSDAIWASFMGSFAILGGGGLQPPSPPPHSYTYEKAAVLVK